MYRPFKSKTMDRQNREISKLMLCALARSRPCGRIGAANAAPIEVRLISVMRSGGAKPRLLQSHIPGFAKWSGRFRGSPSRSLSAWRGSLSPKKASIALPRPVQCSGLRLPMCEPSRNVKYRFFMLNLRSGIWYSFARVRSSVFIQFCRKQVCSVFECWDRAAKRAASLEGPHAG